MDNTLEDAPGACEGGQEEYWIYELCSRTGSRHLGQGLLCQDCGSHSRKDGREAVALLDGTGPGNTNPYVVGKLAEHICTYLLEEFDRLYEEQEEVCRLIFLMEVRHFIESYMLSMKLSAKEVGSTIMAMALDHRNGRFLLFHLGDGVICCRAGGFRILSGPCNGFYRNRTVLTVSDDALKRLRLLRGQAPKGLQQICFATDGCYTFPMKPDQLEKELDAVVCGTFSQEEDDRTILALWRKE